MPEQQNNLKQQPFTRLPNSVRPVRYNLELKIDLESKHFYGFAQIFVSVLNPVKSIQFHSVELEFDSKFNPFLVLCPSNIDTISESQLKENKIESSSVEFEVKSDTCTINFNQFIDPGLYCLQIKYSAVLTNKLCGLYVSKYKSAIDNSIKELACTQFEATDARKCFPCQDEPSLKSEFCLSIIVKSHFEAISNMPIIEKETLPDNQKRVRFAKSPIMSTYLLAIVVGEFDFISTFAGQTEIRIYTEIGNIDRARFALDVAEKMLNFLNKYFEIPYALPKLDLLAIPDFAAGAMENQGCVTYRSNRLLSDKILDTIDGRIDKAGVIAHELVHMWFGNLVTMEQQTHLQLNEGFARFLQFLAVDSEFKDWKMFDIFVEQVYSRAIFDDSLESSHAIEIPVNHPEEIKEIFDGISYAKGASVLRMLHDWLGAETFCQGISYYLNNFKYKNAVTEDLWEALSHVSKRDVAGFMSNWTSKIGYPLLTVEEIPGKTNQIKLSQKRFLLNPNNKVKNDVIQSINATFLSNNKQRFDYQMTKNIELVELPFDEQNKYWCKLNLGQCGFYRVLYPDSQLERLHKPIQTGTIDAVDRWGIISDCFAISFAGIDSIDKPLNLLEAYRNESDTSVVSSICSNLLKLYRLHIEQPYTDFLNEYICEYFQNLYTKIGWDKDPNEPSSYTRLRPIILNALRRSPQVILEARKRFNAFFKNGEKGVEDSEAVSAELRTLVFSLGVKYGGKEAYDTVLEYYRRCDLQEEQNRCLRALGNASDVSKIIQSLQWILSDEVRPANAYIPLIEIASCNWSYEVAWNFFKDNYKEFYNKFPEGMKDVIGYVVLAFARNFNKVERAHEIKKFFEDNPCKEAKKKIEQSIENIMINVSCLEKQSQTLQKWLENYFQCK